jgi:hypothetical protein
MITQDQLAIEIIKNVMKKKNYAFFESGTFNLNLIGIRTASKIPNNFDDWMVAIYKDQSVNWTIKKWRITTDAGTYWLLNPMNNKGTALLVPNQYRKGWKIGLHKGQYKALVQNKPIEVYRDNDKDLILDYENSTIDKGMFGVNIHRSNPSQTSIRVEKWSAGCQVFANPREFEELMDICDIASRQWGSEFTYTLLTEQDFNGL